jgi:hypothetical protein
MQTSMPPPCYLFSPTSDYDSSPLFHRIRCYPSYAALSVPTREYFQSSGWSAPPTPVANTSTSSIMPTFRFTPPLHTQWCDKSTKRAQREWILAAGHDSSHGSNELRQLSGCSDFSYSDSAAVSADAKPHADDSGDDLDGTEIAGGSSTGSRGAHGPSTTSVQARGQ